MDKIKLHSQSKGLFIWARLTVLARFPRSRLTFKSFVKIFDMFIREGGLAYRDPGRKNRGLGKRAGKFCHMNTSSRFPGWILRNSRFAADVIHLRKLSVRHAGAHLKCEISCIHLYTVLFQILCFMDISGGKNPESQENILLRIPALLNSADGLESHVRE